MHPHLREYGSGRSDLKAAALTVLFFAASVGGYFWWQNRSRVAPLTLVLTLDKPHLIGSQELRGAIERGLGLKLAREDVFVLPLRDGVQTLGFEAHGNHIAVSSADRPFGPRDAESASPTFSKHEAWLSLDVLRPRGDIDRARAYTDLARLAVELLTEEKALAIYTPESGRVQPFNDALRARLQAGDPAAALGR